MSGICINIDNSHFFVSRPPEAMTAEAVDACVAAHSGEQVREIMFCVNAQRASFASDVWDRRWEGGAADARAVTMALLHERGIDAHARWLAEARRLGLSPWLSMRMNDNHHPFSPENPGHSKLWRKRPDLRRVTYRPVASGLDVTLDYSQPEVYQHHLALVRELCDRYDLDGLELDWTRHYHCLRPGRELIDAPILTRFVGETRALTEATAQRLGHPVKLGVRVAPTARTSRWLGLDAVGWARQGLVDMVTPTPQWQSIVYDLPVAEWRELLAGTDVLLAAGLERHVRASPQAAQLYPADADMVRGAAAVYLHAGADRVYVFNYFDRYQTASHVSLLDSRPSLLDHIGELETLIDQPRRHLVSYADVQASGEPVSSALPCVIQPHRSGRPGLGQLRLELGAVPSSGAATVVLGLDAEHPAELPAGFAVHVNGTRAAVSGRVELAIPGPTVRTWAFEIDRAALHDGYNLLEITADEQCEVCWAELNFAGR